MNIFGYVRCSTEEQKQSGLGVVSQRQAIDSYLRGRRLVVSELLEDLAESGANVLSSRTGGKRLLELIDSGPCMVICKRLDRLFRSDADGVFHIGTWHQRGVQLISIEEGFDGSTRFGQFIAKLLALIADLERGFIIDRTTAAMAVKIQRGERVSRDPQYGFSFQPSGRFNGQGDPILVQVSDVAEQAAVKLMRQLRRRSWSFREIAAELDSKGIKPRRGEKWSHSSVRKILGVRRKRDSAGGAISRSSTAAELQAPIADGVNDSELPKADQQ